MEILIWLGACITLIGLAGLVWCGTRVWRAHRSGLAGEELHKVLQKVLPIKTGVFFLSMIGLMMVVIGILLS